VIRNGGIERISKTPVWVHIDSADEMAKKSFTGLPYPPMVRLDQDEPVTVTDLNAVLTKRPAGFSLCVRSAAGNENRGGYFFHIAPSRHNSGMYFLVDFDKIVVADSKKAEVVFSIDDLCEFINHCTGLAFSERYLLLSQTELNFRSDPDEDDV
jgi:hypothetical protein